MNPNFKFQNEVLRNIQSIGADPQIKNLSLQWLYGTLKHHYSYNFSFLGRPIIQYPQDIVAIQELIWEIKPDLIIETGIAHGGSLIMSASMLALLDYCEAVKNGEVFDPRFTNRRVLGIDLDIRDHNRTAIEAHPMSHRIDMIQGSSIDIDIISHVYDIAKNHERVLVCLDSNHTHEHVLSELEAYGPLVSMESYCCVFDSIIEDLPEGTCIDRQWDKGNNPKTAVWEYLSRLNDKDCKGADGTRLAFKIDRSIETKLLITVAPDGYLKRVTYQE